MARSRFLDQLQSYAFHLADVTPSLAPPFYTLGMGAPVSFSSCSMPEITLEVESFRQLNSMYQTHIISGASVGSISFSRGVLSVDSSFYRWINRSIVGSDRVHRDLCLLHASSLAPLHQIGSDYKTGNGRPAPNSVKTGADAGLYGMFRVLGKGFILHNCVPTRYKAGGDLDATSGDVSVAELDIQPEYITEFSLDPFQLTDI